MMNQTGDITNNFEKMKSLLRKMNFSIVLNQKM